MRTFIIKYDDRGRVATTTVQGDEVSTVDDLLCIRYDGMPIASFPKEDVLHVTSHGSDDDLPAPAEDDLGMPVGRPVAPRLHPPSMRSRSGMNGTPQGTADLRAIRRVISSPRPFVS